MANKSKKSLMRMRRYGIGVDIGGTKISVVLGDVLGRILEKEVLPTPHGKEVKGAFGLIRGAAQKMLQKRGIKGSELRGVGVGVPGIFDAGSKVILESPNLRDWVGINLEKAIQRVIAIPVAIENDANATAVAEKLFGHGRGVNDFIYITVSTGIGSGLIINGKLYRGKSWSAGEVGHTIVDPNGWKNARGIRGTLEGEASGTAIARKANERLKTRRTIMTRGVNSKDVKAAALKGDSLAREILKEAGEYLGIGLTNLIMVLNPEKIILGGGVLIGKGGDIVFKAMINSVRTQSWPQPFKACEIVRTGFIENIADLGALSLVFES